MYIEGVPELLMQTNGVKIYEKRFRELVFELFRLIYPRFVQTYGIRWVDRESLLETLFVTIGTSSFQWSDCLRLTVDGNQFEPIYLTPEEAMNHDFTVMFYEQHLYAMEVSPTDCWETERGDRIPVQEMHIKHLQNAIKKLQRQLSHQEVERAKQTDEERLMATNTLFKDYQRLALLQFEWTRRQQLNQVYYF